MSMEKSAKSMGKFIKEHKEEIDQIIRSQVKNKAKIDNEDRKMWILNDEGLYDWARREGVRI